MDSFARDCEKSFISVFAQAMGGVWNAAEPEAVDGNVDPVALPFDTTGGLSGALEFVVSKSDASQLATRFAGEEGGGGWGEEQRLACEELFAQVAGDLACRLTKKFGEVRLARASGAIPAARDEVIAVKDQTGKRVPVRIRASQELLSCLARKGSASDAATPSVTKSPCHNVAERNLNLLMGIELSAILRFGLKRMPLREVLDLSAGSVIELDRQVQEPVELLVEGKLVARGEVVVIDGNYGLKVIEVLSQRDRSNLLW